MIDVQRVSLSSKDRDTIRTAREKTGLSQTQAGLTAWPKLSEPSAKATWSQMETNSVKILNMQTLNAALAVVGLELTGTLKIRKART